MFRFKFHGVNTMALDKRFDIAVPVPDELISIRVEYARTYSIVLSESLVEYYGLNISSINDIAEPIFRAITSASSYFQLVSYEPFGEICI